MIIPKYFQIITIPHKFPSDILKNKRLKIGFDPKLHTQKTLKHVGVSVLINDIYC